MVSSRDIRFHIISLGCAKNQVDSERVNGAMLSSGFLPAPSGEEADIIIINTCGFIEDAKEESIALIFDALGERDGRPAGEFGRKAVVIGCLSQRYRDALLAEIPEIDYLEGIPDDGFVERMSRHFGIAAEPPRNVRAPLVQGLAYDYIKISEGCSNNCSYCAIPLIRGPRRDYHPDLIHADAMAAAARGARELVIVAQDAAAYRHGDIDLPGLVRRLATIDGIDWIRLMYCHPDHVDEGIIALLEEGGRVVPYIDLPFQHASASVLASMGRRGSAPAYLDLLGRLRDRVKGIRVRSTFMVGYPTEGDGDFEELLDFLQKARIDRVGAFIYSPEEGTPAWTSGDPVPFRVKKRRYHRLMSLQRDISAASLEAMIGNRVRVLVEERLEEGTWAGRSEYDAPEVDGVFFLTGEDLRVNSIVTARVTGAFEYDLTGVVS